MQTISRVLRAVQTLKQKEGDSISKERLARVQAWLREEKLDAALFTNLKNIRYLTGFAPVGADPEEAFLLVTPNRTVLQTSPFYWEKARRLAPHIPLSKKGRGEEFLKEELRGIKRLAVEGRDMSAYRASWLKSVAPALELKFMHTAERLRVVKNQDELQAMRKAIEVTRKAMEVVVEQAAPGVTEKELVKTFKKALIDQGAEEAFSPIIARGPHGAEPHFDEPDDKPLKPGDLVVMDVGARVDNYNSDLTRMIVIGKPSKEARKILKLVEDAQTAAIAHVAPGVPTAIIHQAAREVIEKAGYGKNFNHGTGHGVGEDVHELPGVPGWRDPNQVYPPEDMVEPPIDTLAAGHVITVEPGVYLAKRFGVRMEDMLLVTEQGHVNLSGHIPKIFYKHV